jgi:hypothetical protein
MLEGEKKGTMLFAKLRVFIARMLRCAAILVMADRGAKLVCA